MAGLLDNIKAGLLGQWEEGEPYRAALGGLLMGDTAPAKEALGVGKPWPKNIDQNEMKQQAYQLAMDWNNPMQGILGTFIGKGAKTWDAVKAAEAQKLLKKGIDPKEVWQKTGTFQGVDGHLRQEIPDHSSYLKGPSGDIADAVRYGKTVGATTYHPALEKAYPEIKDIGVELRTGTGGAYGDNLFGDSPSIAIGIENKGKSTMLHELQHAIQQREGWARGGSPDSIKVDDLLPMDRQQIEKVRLVASKMDEAGFTGAAQEHRRNLNKIAPEMRDRAYRYLAGEAEARLTQSRMHMTPEQRLQSYPYDMLDVPQEQLIIRGLLGQ